MFGIAYLPKMKKKKQLMRKQKIKFQSKNLET